MNTSYNTTNQQKALLTFNVFFREDTTTQRFLSSIIDKDPEHWKFFRNVFKGQDKCTLTLVDRSIETPFHCLLVVLLCKQLEKELGIDLNGIKLILTPIRNEEPTKTVLANLAFGTTDDRNNYLRECFTTILGKTPTITTKRNPVYCRDLKISSRDYALYIRVEGGVGNGWQIVGGENILLTPQELLGKSGCNLPCRNIYTHSFSRNGVFLNFDLLTNLSYGAVSVNN